MKNKFYIVSVLALGIASCTPEFEKEVNADYTAGDLDFSRYVAVGNSLTAGFSDGTVFKEAQGNSYPKLLSNQFALVGGGAFTQPSYEDDVNNLGGLTLGGVVISGARRVIDASQSRPEVLVGTPTITLTPQAKAYNNMGVPGAKSFHLLASGYGNVAGVSTGAANPYFVRHATTPSATIMADAMSLNPTFFTNWIGANDVLAYSTSGGVGVSHNDTANLNPATYGPNDITNNTVFGQVYGTILNTLTGGGAKGIVMTVPSVTSIPYFTTVPFAPLSPTTLGAANITALNTNLYGPLKQALTAFGQGSRINLLSSTSANPVLIVDESLTNLSTQLTAALTPALGATTAAAFGAIYGQARQATAQDLILLTSSGVIGTPNMAAPASINVWGVSYPLSDQYTLTADEISKVNAATTAYNTAIRTLVDAKNTAAGKKVVAVVDMNAILQQLVSGLRVETGQIYTANYFSGTAAENKVLFSLDGVHPNQRGYAVIANEIIKALKVEFKTNLPLVNQNNYKGIYIVATN